MTTPDHATPQGGDADLEKAVGLTFASETKQTTRSRPSHPPHNYGQRARDTIRHFLHPDGKRIHVAASPEEAQKLRSKLSRLHHEDEFDVYISGTPEHLEAVHKAREHHEAKRDELREQHKDIFERFQDVHAELDMLSNELERVTTHGVSLEAHFSKFGYDAHIRSYEDDDSPSQSGSSTPTSLLRKGSSASSVAEGSHAAKPLKLFKMPVVRQYFHKGILWRASRAEEVQSFELFVDLLYVGIIAINGDAASEDPTGSALLRFVITFTLSWKIWNDMAQIISWFETDDIFQRFSILFLLACLFGYTTNILRAFEPEHSTYATLMGFYLCSRLYMGLYLLGICFVVPMVRPIMTFHFIIIAIGVVLWIGSIHVEWPNQLALIWLALFIDVCGPIGLVIVKTVAYMFHEKGREWFDNVFEFWPAINIEHRTERMNAFVTLVFGYTVVAMLYQSTVNGVDAFFGKAILGLIQAFAFNWMYFEVDGTNLFQHAIRRHKATAIVWSMIHLPFIMAFVLGGGALSRLVVATDTPGSDLEHLTETYAHRSEHEIRTGVRWFYCAGFGVALACMGVISISHIHKEIEGLRLRKRYRLAWRFGIAVVLICLPLAEGLNSLELVGTVTALVVFALGVELWATSCCHEKLFARSSPCRYTGLCKKGELQEMVTGRKKVCIEQLGSGEKSSREGLIVGP